MRPNRAIDKPQKTCYQKQEGSLSTFIVEPRGGINKKRLFMALNLILSEKDVTDHFSSEDHPLPNKEQI